jgi:outer membrane biosynthesis protein TonB
MTPQYRQAFVAALTGHFVLIVAAVLVSVLPGCLRPKSYDVPVELLSVIPKDTTRLSRPRELPPPPPPPAPPAGDNREPPTPKTPDEPAPLPPVRDLTPLKPVRDPSADTVVDAGRRPPRPPANTVNAATNRPAGRSAGVVIGPRVIRPVAGSAGARTRTAPRLSEADWARLLGANAPVGDTVGVPLDERARCALLIKKAFHDAWDPPSIADAGGRPGELEVRFDLGGRVVEYKLVVPSGSEACDRTVLAAARAVARVDGLSAAFLRESARRIVVFNLSEQ